MEVEDILGIPILDRSMRILSTKYGMPEFDEFKAVLSYVVCSISAVVLVLIVIASEMVDLKGSAAAIITRPPEILACVKLVLSATLNIFIIFDSHPRQRYPDGTGLLIFASVEGTARALAELLPVVDLSESGLQWQAQLLSNYSAHILVPRPVQDRQGHLKHIAMDSSLEILALRERARQGDRLLQENERLGRRVEELEQQLRRERARGKRVEMSSVNWPTFSHGPQNPRAKTVDSSSSSSLHGTTSITHPTTSASSSSGVVHQQSQSKEQPSSLDETGLNPIDGTDEAFHDALELQHQFDQEDQQLRRQMTRLAQDVQQTFRCEVCFDELPEDVVMRVNGCGHGFCRDCIRGHVQSKLQDHRYPILCPVCAASKGDDQKPSGVYRTRVMFLPADPA